MASKTGMYCLTVLEATFKNQGLGRAMVPPTLLREDPSLLLPASGDPRLSGTCGCVIPISASVFTRLSSPHVSVSLLCLSQGHWSYWIKNLSYSSMNLPN